MAEKNQSVLLEILKDGYQKVFYTNWPAWLGGILIGIMSIITFIWARPWGVAGGLRNWGDNFFYLIGLYSDPVKSPLLSSSSLLSFGLLVGAFASSLLAKEFAIRKAPPLELVKGIVGGILMGIGASMAGGCNVGGFFSATSAMSLSGLCMMVGLVFGAYLGLKYLYWELEKFPTATSSQTIGSQEGKANLKNIEPYIGLLVIILSIVGVIIYNKMAYTILGGLYLCGFIFGLIIQRTRFCFVRCFREPFMTGEAEVARAVVYAVIISLIGFAIIKWLGFRKEYVYVPSAFWIGGLLGGVIFGFGMVIAGGCGSGSLWRCGEGQVKLFLAVIFFSLSISLFEKFTAKHPAFQKFLGKKVFLPYYLNYKWSVILIIAFMLIYYLWACWNEKTEKFVVEL